MNKHVFRPFIRQYILSLCCYIILPIILILSGIIEIVVHDSQYGYYSGALFIATIVIYSYYLIVHFVPGSYAVLDLLTQNFISRNVVYRSSYVESNWYTVGCSRSQKKTQSSKLLSKNYHLIVLMADKNGRIALCTSFFHEMDCGKSYTVTYGRYSKIIRSIISTQGEEMLLFDVE